MAFTNTWNAAFEAQPADTENVSLGASRIRAHKLAVRERLIIDHSHAGDADDGKHKQITFVNPLGADPGDVADEGMLYTKNVSAKAELFWKDEDGNVIQVTSGGVLGGIVGEIRIWPTGTAPSGWVLCDGTAYNSTADTTFAALFAVIANVFGGSDGTDFKVPDLKGRAAIGAGTGDAADATAHAIADKEGTEGHTLLTAEIPAHTHSVPSGAGSPSTYVDGATTQEFSGAQTTGSTGGGGAHNNLQPSLTLNYIIKK